MNIWKVIFYSPDTDQYTTVIVEADSYDEAKDYVLLDEANEINNPGNIYSVVKLVGGGNPGTFPSELYRHEGKNG